MRADLGKMVEESGARIEVAPLPVVMCDPVQMRQLLQNVVTNALKYRHANRKPIITIAGVIHTPSTGANRPGVPMLELTVADNGIGFEQRFAERIFEPFQRLHSTDDYEGSGIGLAICRKIIDRHGGTIAALGRPGEGAVFTIMLPLRPLPEPVQAPP